MVDRHLTPIHYILSVVSILISNMKVFPLFYKIIIIGLQVMLKL